MTKVERSEYQKERKRRLREAGLCQYCKKPCEDHLACSECREKDTLRKTKKRKELRGSGFCSVCQKPSTMYRCNDCLPMHYRAQKRRYKKMTENGLCIGCGIKVDGGFVYCVNCADKSQERAIIRRSL